MTFDRDGRVDFPARSGLSLALVYHEPRSLRSRRVVGTGFAVVVDLDI